MERTAAVAGAAASLTCIAVEAAFLVLCVAEFETLRDMYIDWYSCCDVETACKQKYICIYIYIYIYTYVYTRVISHEGIYIYIYIHTHRDMWFWMALNSVWRPFASPALNLVSILGW